MSRDRLVVASAELPVPVVLYGGAFDPPTLAHEAAVAALSKMADRVVIVPS